MNVTLKKLSDNAITPTRGSAYAAGYDLYSCLDAPVTIQPFHTAKIPTGLSMSLPDGFAGLIYARSGLATKNGVRPANCVGLCDADYRGEYIVALHNDSTEPYTVNHGERIAQLVIAPVAHVNFIEGDLGTTERGDGGFGSTGR